MDNGVRYLIHKIGTRKIDLRGTGMKYTMPAPEYWHDNPRGGQWGAASTATGYTSQRAAHLPDGGEWIEIYVGVTE